MQPYEFTVCRETTFRVWATDADDAQRIAEGRLLLPSDAIGSMFTRTTPAVAPIVCDERACTTECADPDDDWIDGLRGDPEAPDWYCTEHRGFGR